MKSSAEFLPTWFMPKNEKKHKKPRNCRVCVLTSYKERAIIWEVSILECRPMVGHLSLEQVIGVRIPALQP